jgi:hypothetical protein
MNLSNLVSKIKNYFSYELIPVDADYYNGSENDLENIFLEIQKMSNEGIDIFNKYSFQDRLRFLVNEGINIINISNVKPKSFKLTQKEIDALVLKKPEKKISKRKINKNIREAVEDYRKNVKSSVGLKSLKPKKNIKK